MIIQWCPDWGLQTFAGLEHEVRRYYPLVFLIETEQENRGPLDCTGDTGKRKGRALN